MVASAARPPACDVPAAQCRLAGVRTEPHCVTVPCRRKVVMPDADMKSVFEVAPDEALEARLDADAEAAYRAGRVVPHDRVSAWLARLARGEKVPPPRG